jgi:hypothetical protein
MYRLRFLREQMPPAPEDPGSAEKGGTGSGQPVKNKKERNYERLSKQRKRTRTHLRARKHVFIPVRDEIGGNAR